MTIGVPKEIKKNENRVGMTPAGVRELINHKHKVLVEQGAGIGSGFTDAEYTAAGATIVKTAKEAWGAEMVIKVKEPLPEEFGFFRPGLILYTYLHLAPEVELTQALLDKKVTGIAYETVELENGFLPLLAPMSEVAGRMSIQVGAHHLEKLQGGRGVLLGGVPGVAPAEVVIIGGGVVGLSAARMAVGMGASVTILDISRERLAYIDDIFQGRVKTLISNAVDIAECVKKADLLVGGVLIAGAAAPKLVTEAMVKTMQKGSVIVDVAIDQGGCVETIDRITYHDNPTFEKHGVVHYSVANMPGAVPRTSTFALTSVTLPFAVRLANLGVEEACKQNPALAKGVNTHNGNLTYQAVAKSQNRPYTPYATVATTITNQTCNIHGC
ncbi:MAG: alanine dehydrogenase [Firmicutes bacterium]|nr:alanine dehydrogenase [Bacillota bacterium]